MAQKQKLNPETPPLSTQEKERTTQEFLKARDKEVQAMEDAFEKNIKKTSKGIDRRALTQWQKEQMRQSLQIHKKFLEARQEYYKQAENLDSKAERNKLLSKVIDQYKEKIRGHRQQVEHIILTLKQGESLTTEEVAAIIKALENLETFQEQHQDLEPIFEKLAKKQKLERSDYERILELINPFAFSKNNVASSKAIEATAAGVILQGMTTDQRVELLEVFMDSEKKGQTAQLIDMMLRTDLLPWHKAQKVLDSAEKKGVIIAQERQKAFTEKQKEYEQALANFLQAKEKEVSQYRGVSARNFANEAIFGPQTWGLLMAAWGAATVFTNVLASRRKGESFLSTTGRVVTNPYTWLGVAATGAGAEIMTSSTTGNSLMGEGVGAKALAPKKKPSELRQERETNLARNFNHLPGDLQMYLANQGGYETLQKVYEEKILPEIREGTRKKDSFTIADLLAAEKNPDQRARLERLQARKDIPAFHISQGLFTIAEGASGLKIKTTKDLLEVI